MGEGSSITQEKMWRGKGCKITPDTENKDGTNSEVRSGSGRGGRGSEGRDFTLQGEKEFGSSGLLLPLLCLSPYLR